MAKKNTVLIKFRVRMIRNETKEIEVMASDMYKAQKIGRSIAEKHDWTDFDNMFYTALAEPWNIAEKKRR